MRTSVWFGEARLVVAVVTLYVAVHYVNAFVKPLVYYTQKDAALRSEKALYAPHNDNALNSESPENMLLQAMHHSRRDFISMAAWTPTLLGSYPTRAAIATNVQASEGINTNSRSINTDATTNDYNNTIQEIIPFSTIRNYKQLTLSNGMQVILVSDQRAFLAQVALTVGAIGQFNDPTDLPGLAHLLEHMVLSNNVKSDKNEQDFEDWLNDRDGVSNGFTAYDSTAFHFTCPGEVLPEALDQFAYLFEQGNVEKNCWNEKVVRREIRRVDSELSLDSEASQMLYLSKGFVNPEHPFAQLSAGSLYTLEQRPKKMNINISERLVQHFRQRYQANNTILVVIGRPDVLSLEKMVQPFASTMSNTPMSIPSRQCYPGSFLVGKRNKQTLLYRGSEKNVERAVFEWTLGLDYANAQSLDVYTPTACQVAFVLSQTINRRGPGSLYYFLKRRGYVPSGMSGTPKFSLLVDVSCFQILRLEFALTAKGVLNRSSVVNAVFDCLRIVQETPLSRLVLAQYSTTCKLHGYYLTPRPPDAVELAMDAQLLGPRKVSDGQWYRFPESQSSLSLLQRAYSDSLAYMVDTANTLITIVVNNEVLKMSQKNILLQESIPMLSSSQWLREPITNAIFCYDDFSKIKSRVEKIVLSKLVVDEELVTTAFNPLVPANLRGSRETQFSGNFVRGSSWSELVMSQDLYNEDNDNYDNARDLPTSRNWILLQPQPGQRGLVLPRMPPEPSCRAVVVLQLLSSRPARANTRQAAQAELWKLTFESAVNDLAELGVPAALAYDISFNKYGLRLAFLGLSQNVGSYARRLCRRLVQHSIQLFEGPEILPSTITSTAVRNANRIPGLSIYRRQVTISSLRRSTAYEAAAEGNALLRSCTGAACFAQGDILPSELVVLLADLEFIFSGSINNRPLSPVVVPSIEDIDYPPVWKPRAASICSIAGSGTMIDACGRLPR